MVSSTLTKIKLAAVALLIGAAPVALLQAPPAMADPVSCNVGAGLDPDGIPYGGKADGPHGGRIGGKGSVFAGYEVQCNQAVSVVLHWTVIGPDVGSTTFGNAFLNLTCNGADPTRCVATFTSPPKKLAYNLTGDRSFSASGTADVFPAGTFSGTPLTTFKVLTSVATL
jgi:hypothetical protein